VYAVAQGNVMVGGAGGQAGGTSVTVNQLSAGRIPAGAIVERAVPMQVGQGDTITYELGEADFGTAQRVVDAINKNNVSGTAWALDGRRIQVRAPETAYERVAFLGRIENLDVTPIAGVARVIVNARTGSVVMNQMVTLQECAISHGNLAVSVSSDSQVSQPNALSNGRTTVTESGSVDLRQFGKGLVRVQAGANLADVVRALSVVGATPLDLINILQAMKAAGALRAELEVI
jgi:flagellar P-ring protein precursor FlgI